MELTEAEKTEIKEYIIGVPRYVETYNELYDHVLNALQSSEDTYRIEVVAHIIQKDFNGFSAIVKQEELYQQQLIKKYKKMFFAEMGNTFKGVELIKTVLILLLCVCFYYYSVSNPVNWKPLIVSIVIISFSVATFGLFKVYWNKRTSQKPSILDSSLTYSSLFGVLVIGGFMNLLIGKADIFELSEHSKTIALLIFFLFSSIYVRGFMKFYSRKFKVLATS